MDSLLFKDIGIVAVVALPLFFLIKWITEEFKQDLIRSHSERAKWQEIMMGFQNCINENTSQAKGFHEQVNEAHRFQREEHKEMMANLKEITTTLGRINGYKDEHK